MSALLAQFEKRFVRGPTIRCDVNVPSNLGGVTVLFGPSGCGKTTILRVLAGLEVPDVGQIKFGKELWFDAARRVSMAPQARGVGLLFQHYALFPHLTVRQNIAYGMRMRQGQEAQAEVTSLLTRLQIGELAERYPSQLSGGQQQRVALARAIATRPRLLLLDEPLSALDAPVREVLRSELRRVLVELGRPAIVVTHDRVEALALADTVAVMTDGEIRQTGAVQEVFNRPGTLEIAKIVGVETVAAGQITEERDGLVTVNVCGVLLTAIAPRTSGRAVFACIRGEDVLLQRAVSVETSARNQLAARVTSCTPEGPLVRIGLDCGFPLTALVTRPACEELHLQIGDPVTALVKAQAIHLVEHG